MLTTPTRPTTNGGSAPGSGAPRGTAVCVRGLRRSYGAFAAVRGIDLEIEQLKFPIVVTGIARGAATMRPYRCLDCGAKVKER